MVQYIALRTLSCSPVINIYSCSFSTRPFPWNLTPKDVCLSKEIALWTYMFSKTSQIRAHHKFRVHLELQERLWAGEMIKMTLAPCPSSFPMLAGQGPSWGMHINCRGLLQRAVQLGIVLELVMLVSCAFSWRKVVSHKLGNPTTWDLICDFHWRHGQLYLSSQMNKLSKKHKVITSTWKWNLVTKPEKDPLIAMSSFSKWALNRGQN